MSALVALALLLGIGGVVLLRPARRRASTAASDRGEAVVRANALALRDRLDHAPFGEALMRDVWQGLQGCAVDEGLVHSFHRDFCGHGLIRTADGVKLCDIQDGGYLTGTPIAAWQTEAAFVAF